MTPEEMEQMKGEAGAEGPQDQEPISQLVQEVGQGLSKLIQVINQSQASTDQDRESASNVMQAYMGLVDGLGQEAGQNPEAPQQADMGAVPMQAGQSGKPMGPETRQ